MRDARPTRRAVHASSRDRRADGSSSDDDDDGVDAFILRETKSRGWDEFRSLLDDVRAYRRRDVDAADADAAHAFTNDDADARLPIGKSYIDGVYALAGSSGTGRDGRELTPAWPLLTYALATRGDGGENESSGGKGASTSMGSTVMGTTPPRRTGFDTREHAERHARRVQGLHAGGLTAALGYSRMELATLGNVEKRRAFGELYRDPSECVRHLCSPGRVWEGTISIPGSGDEEATGSPYAFQVLWFDAAAGAFLVSHTAQGDEQLCHLTLHDDGKSGTMALSFADNETYCSGTIDGATGTISGTVGQLLRAEEGFFERADSLRNTFLLKPVDIDDSTNEVDASLEPERREQISRVMRRRKLIAQWSRSANVLSATYRVIQFIKDTMRSEHMWNYMLRKITFETKLMRLEQTNDAQSRAFAAAAVAAGRQTTGESAIDSYEMAPESTEQLLQDQMNRLMRRPTQMLWTTFPSPGLEAIALGPAEIDWCDIWTIERMNAELLGCKFRMYTRLLRARVFQTSKEKQQYLSEFKTLRSECHNEMNRVLSNMNLLLWRLFYGSDMPRNDRQALVKNMVGILRVEEARMIIAYDNVDKALRECDARLPINAIKQRCSIAGDESYTCSICLLEIERGEEVLTLDCSHSFHLPCCSTWLHTHATCPNCRTVLS